MEQYFRDKETRIFKDILPNDSLLNVIFINELFEKIVYKNFAVNYSTIANMGFKKCRFTQINFSHCTFINCFFGRAHFEDVNFVECKFIDCNFGSATIVACDFRYARFQGCFILYRDMKKNLPSQPNLRWDLVRNIAIQCLNLGDTSEYRLYFFAEKDASEQHFWKMFIHDESFYKNKYGLWESVSGLLRLITSKISKFLWGYGESILSLLAVISGVIIIFTLLYLSLPGSFSRSGSNVSYVSLSFIQCGYYAISSFFNITNDLIPLDNLIIGITLIENVIGLVLTGFLIAALFRYINRR